MHSGIFINKIERDNQLLELRKKFYENQLKYKYNKPIENRMIEYRAFEFIDGDYQLITK